MGDEDYIKELRFVFENVCTHKHIDMRLHRLVGHRDRDDPETLIVSMLAEIAAWEPVPEIEVKYPRDWWQAFRERWAPKWWLRRHPVQYVEQRWVAAELLPNMPMPEGWRKDRKIGFLKR